MQLTTSQLSNNALRAEQEISTTTPFLVDRFSPVILSGQAVYDMPAGLFDIKRVTWLGRKITPIDHRRFREGGHISDAPGLPYSYIFNNIGRMQIQFYYTPNEDVAAGVGDLWSPLVIPTCVVIEFYRVADGVDFKLPDYCRSRLLKHYLAYQANKVEGQGQVMRTAKYFKSRWENSQTLFKKHVQDMIGAPRKLSLTSNLNLPYNGIQRRLPSNFGESVD